MPAKLPFRATWPDRGDVLASVCEGLGGRWCRAGAGQRWRGHGCNGFLASIFLGRSFLFLGAWEGTSLNLLRSFVFTWVTSRAITGVTSTVWSGLSGSLLCNLPKQQNDCCLPLHASSVVVGRYKACQHQVSVSLAELSCACPEHACTVLVPGLSSAESVGWETPRAWQPLSQSTAWPDVDSEWCPRVSHGGQSDTWYLLFPLRSRVPSWLIAWCHLGLSLQCLRTHQMWQAPSLGRWCTQKLWNWALTQQAWKATGPHHCWKTLFEILPFPMSATNCGSCLLVDSEVKMVTKASKGALGRMQVQMSPQSKHTFSLRPSSPAAALFCRQGRLFQPTFIYYFKRMNERVP